MTPKQTCFTLAYGPHTTTLSHQYTPLHHHPSPGGGAALLWASRQLEDVKAACDNMDQKIGTTMSPPFDDTHRVTPRHTIAKHYRLRTITPSQITTDCEPSHHRKALPIANHHFIANHHRLRTIKLLTFFSTTHCSSYTGVEIIERACRVPLRTICNNAGFEGSVVVSATQINLHLLAISHDAAFCKPYSPS
jgi:hypothetical protein